MFALLGSLQALARADDYGMWAAEGVLDHPEQGIRSTVSSTFSNCHQRACQVSGIFGPNGRLAGNLKECWADGLCTHEVSQFPNVDVS